MSLVLCQLRRTFAFFGRFTFEAGVFAFRVLYLLFFLGSHFFAFQLRLNERGCGVTLMDLMRILHFLLSDVRFILPFFKGLARLLVHRFVDQGVFRCVFRVCWYGLLYIPYGQTRRRRATWNGGLFRARIVCDCAF